ncbi:MAG: peptidoglycan peptidase [Flavobacteriales bacterium]|nr:peptidoglycan peptidase [Flavobacteriales bacterium]MBK6945496.1 peptidoglycan peptidase [Flavobacteriales bacterium]MBK9534949.1 peptidoglycan peptidase [Flavobacteriales bacterium]HQZ43399.1 YiiX/YebB-like N1pC/P60 family cysteine hydrolase [Flavobacteriales bacterium]HQZ92963.1 YiiX/YebB-like N1pC/P60 family cysteine hydrolase [Flavobacteriales bacterium]
MKRALIISGFALTLIGYAAKPTEHLPRKFKASSTQDAADLRSGDILFQTMPGGQSEAIALATGSKWTHVGIVFKENEEWIVYEAVGPVKATPLDEWVKQGDHGHFAAKRLKLADEKLGPEAIVALRAGADRFMGIAYDRQFGWSDETIYCSELVWKMYADALNIELCSPKPMRDHVLGSEVVQRTMKERYGSAPPLDELMIGPGALFDCPLLVTVLEK